MYVSEADYTSVDCEMTLDGGHDRTLVVGPSNGNRCGGELYPWRLRVDPGQRVNVTLVQFSVDEDRDDEAPGGDDSPLSVVDHQYHVADDAADTPAVRVIIIIIIIIMIDTKDGYDHSVSAVIGRQTIMKQYGVETLHEHRTLFSPIGKSCRKGYMFYRP